MAKHVLDEDFNRKKYQIWFNSIFPWNNKLKLQLYEEFKSAKNIYEMPEKKLIESPFLDLKKMAQIQKYKKITPDEIYEKLLTIDMDFTTIEEEDYPGLLQEIPDKPYCLYYLGHLPEKSMPSVGVVGARMSTNYGKSIAHDIGYSLAKCGINVVSGMALGVDCASQNGALEASGMTTAILGSSVDICYPEKNKPLYNALKKSGCILSEYPPNTEARPAFFPLRNRIISGMSSALIVTEARVKSGSLITANLASSYGRDVYALPGRITDPLSIGTNHLITEGALVLESIEDLIKNLNEKFNRTKGDESIFSNEVDNTLTEKESLIYDVIDYYATHLDDISFKTKIFDTELNVLLTNLKNKGKISEIFPDYFVRI